MDPRTGKSPARFLAPLALIIALVAFLAIVTSSGGGGSSTTSSETTAAPTSSTKSATTAATSTTTAAKKKSPAARRFYTIQVGDTFGLIADKTGVPLETLQELNPDVDPHAMTTGQRIRLR
jgi:LysM repeat protein